MVSGHFYFLLCTCDMMGKNYLQNTLSKQKEISFSKMLKVSISTPSATSPVLVSNIKLEQSHSLYPIPTKQDSVTVISASKAKHKIRAYGWANKEDLPDGIAHTL